MGIGGISMWQLLILLLIVVLVFGTKRLRNMGGDLGAAVKGFRKGMEEVKDDLEEKLEPDQLATDERLPRVARTLGGLARKARSSWLNLKRSIETEMRAEDLKEPLKHFENEIKSTVDEVKSGVDSIKRFDPLTPEPTEKPDGTDDGK